MLDEKNKMPKDSCYHSVKARYDVFPSARASQAIAKCRKGKGSVRKSDKGTNLKRWQSEKWTDTKTGKACGAGGSNEYCRPKNKVSSKTPKTIGEMSKSELKRKKAEKSKVGMGRRVTSLNALGEMFELDSKAEQRYVNYHRGKMHRTYAKDRGRNQAKKAGVGAALGGIAGGILGGRRGFRKGLKGAVTGAAIGGVAGLGSPTRNSKKNKMIGDVKRRAVKEHTVRAYGQQAQRKGHSFYINPKYNKKTYA